MHSDGASAVVGTIIRRCISVHPKEKPNMWRDLLAPPLPSFVHSDLGALSEKSTTAKSLLTGEEGEGESRAERGGREVMLHTTALRRTIEASHSCARMHVVRSCTVGDTAVHLRSFYCSTVWTVKKHASGCIDARAFRRFPTNKV